MDPASRESLARHYADFDDTELIRRAHSGELAEIDKAIVETELQLRGIPLAMPATAKPAAGHGFVDDHSDANFYQAPDAPVSAVPGIPLRMRIAHVLWWIYSASLALIALRFLYVAGIRRSVSGTFLIMSGLFVTSAVGLVAWRLGKRVLRRGFWRVFATVATALESLLGVVAIVGGLIMYQSDGPVAALSIFLIFIFLIPLTLGLQRYASADGHGIWTREN